MSSKLWERSQAFKYKCKLSESCYAVADELSAESINSVFRPLIDMNDTLIIVKIEKPFSGQMNGVVRNWLDTMMQEKSIVGF